MKIIYKLSLNDLLNSSAIQAFTIYTLWYLSTTLSNQSTIAVFGSMSLIGIVLSPFGGILSDHGSRLRIITNTSILRFISFAIFFLSFFILKKTEALLVLICGILSAISSFYTPALESVVPEISTSDSELLKNNSYINMINQTSSIFGAAIAGVLVFWESPFISYLIILLLLFFSVLFLLKINLTKDFQSSHQSMNINKLILNLPQQFRIAFSTKIIRVLFPYACCLNISFWLFYYYMPLYLRQIFKTIPSAFSIQEFVVSFFSVISGLLVTRYSKYILKHSNLYVPLLLLQSIGISLMPLFFLGHHSPSFKILILIIAWGMYGTFNFASSLLFITKIQQQVPTKQLGTVFGIVFAFFGAASPIAASLSGLLKITITSLNLFLIGLPTILIPIIMFFDKRIRVLMQNQ